MVTPLCFQQQPFLVLQRGMFRSRCISSSAGVVSPPASFPSSPFLAMACCSPSPSPPKPLLSARCRFSVSRVSYPDEGNDTVAEEDDVGSEEEGDLDEELDALFDEFGKTVVESKEQRSVTAEVDDDAESLALAVALAKAANDVKGADIKVLHVKPLVYWTRYFVIVTAFSRPQIDAVGKRIRDAAEEFEKIPSGDTKPNSWTLLDFGDVIVHIFNPKEREYYNLEQFYGNAARIDLPFQSSTPQ